MKTLILLFTFWMSAHASASQVTCVSTTEDLPTVLQMELGAEGFQDILVNFLDDGGFNMHSDAIRNDDVIASEDTEGQNIQLSLPKTFGWDNALLVVPKRIAGRIFSAQLLTYDRGSNDPWEIGLSCQ